MTKLNILLLLLVSSFSGCWLGNDFSENCVPATCNGTCQDNICVAPARKTDTDVEKDTGDDVQNDVVDNTCTKKEECPASQICNTDGVCEAISCEKHVDCDQTTDLKGTELCVTGSCQQVLFKEEGGQCDELYIGKNQLLDVTPEDTIIIPVVTSVTGEGAAAQTQNATNNGYRLAVNLANSSNALGGKKFVFIMCDDNSSEAVSQSIATKLLDRTNANVYLGQNLGDISTKVATQVTKRGVFTLLNNADIAYASVDDDDLAFRTFPSDSLGIQGMLALVDRYKPGTLGLLYQTDQVVFDNAGSSVRRSLTATVTVAKFTTGDYTQAVSDLKSATNFGANDPVEMLLVIGSTTEIPGVVSAYHDALDNKFDNKTPRIVLLGEAGFASKSVLSIDANIEPRKVELTAGALQGTPAFASLYDAEYDAVNPPTSSAAFDSAIITMIVIAASEADATGADLKTMVRTQFSATAAKQISVVDDGLGFGDAVKHLRMNGELTLLSASGGFPTVFDENGDTSYPVASFSFRPAEAPTPEGFRLFRAFLPTVSIDQCLLGSIGMACEQGYTDDPSDPGQICTPPEMNGFPYGSCLPKCDTTAGNEIACPTGFACTNIPMVGELCTP